MSGVMRVIGGVDISRDARYSCNVCRFETTVLLNKNMKYYFSLIVPLFNTHFWHIYGNGNVSNVSDMIG